MNDGERSKMLAQCNDSTGREHGPFNLDPARPEMKLIRDSLFRQIGKPTERKEDLRLVTGRGRFSDDFRLPGQCFAAIVRSPHAHARIKGVDKAAALATSGVLAVLTGADVIEAGLMPIPHNPVPSTKYDMKLTAPDGSKPFIGPNHLLPLERARHVGEAVAIVVAETAAQAAEASELVDVDYQVLPHVIDSADACRPGAPAVWDEVPGNVFIETWLGNPEAADAAFAAAAHQIKAEFHIHRVTAVTMEPRAALGSFDSATGI